MRDEEEEPMERSQELASTFQTRLTSAPYRVMSPVGDVDDGTETETMDTTFETQCELMSLRSEPDHYGALLAKIACQ